MRARREFAEPRIRERLRVALLAGTLAQAGAEKQLMYCARGLAEAGVDLRIYSLTRDEAYEGVLKGLALQPSWAGPSTNPLLRLATLGKLMRSFHPHVIQSFHGFTNLYVGLIARWLGAIGVGGLRISLRHFRQANGGWTRWLLRAPTGLVVNSHAVLQEVVDSGYLARRQIYFLPNVIDLAEFDRSAQSGDAPAGAESGRCTVMFVGRLVPQKRGDRFLHVLATASRRGASIKGLVVGGGPERSAMEDLAWNLGLLPHHVAFLGPRRDVPALLTRADMLVLCSDDEGVPNVILEAMAAGRPVITTPAGDAASVVADGVTGYVVPFDDIEGMAERIAHLAASPHLRRRLGTSGRRRVEQDYSGDGLAGRLLSIYRQMAHGLGHRQVLNLLRTGPEVVVPSHTAAMKGALTTHEAGGLH